MEYIDRKDTLIIDTDEILDSIEISKIIPYISKPIYYIYFQFEDKIYGLVNTYDLRNHYRNKDKTIKINKDFDYLTSKNCILAKKFFKEDPDESKEIAVLEDGYLVGAFIKATKFSVAKSIYDFTNMYAYYDEREIVQDGKKVCLIGYENVMSDDDVAYLKKYFEDRKLVFSTITYDVFFKGYYDFDLLLFANEYEYDSYEFVSYLLGKDFQYDYYASLISYVRKYSEDKDSLVSRDYMGKFFVKLQEKGITVFNVFFEEFKSIIRYNEILENNYKSLNIPISEKKVCFPEEFFGEDYSKEYEEKIMEKDLNIKSKYGVNYIEDTSTEYFNVKDGIRLTLGNNPNPDSCIHLFGPCITLGNYTDDSKTIGSYLQSYLNDNGFNINVINHGVWNNNIGHLELISNTELHPGDIVIFFFMYEQIYEIYNIEVGYHFRNNEFDPKWFVNNCYHFNYIVNNYFAVDIYNNIVGFLNHNKADESVSIKNNYSVLSKVYLQRHFGSIDLSKYEKIGSIVMNCNPFTLGHRYLIETASKEVDFLIIFVLSEDESIFSSNERFAMVREGVKDLPNVYVVPSSYNIISKKTFPEYFIKVEDEKMDFNIERDLDIFVNEIAKELNIKYRFVGEEPQDKVTRRYNEIMKKVLPENGIELIEIKRKEKNKNIISASLVRKLIEEGKIEEAKNYLPQTSIDMIFTDL